MTPTYPILQIERRFIELTKVPYVYTKVQSTVLINPSVCIVYDSNGKKWTYKYISDKFKNSFWTRLLAAIYGPRVEATIVWNDIGTYALQELKTAINNCVDADDDIITQFEEGSVIKKAIDNAESYTDIINVLNKYVFEVNEEELWKEQEEKDNQ